MSQEAKKIDIRKLQLEELTRLILDLGQPKFRAKQIYEWLWAKGVTNFDEMTNLSKEFRIKLKEQFDIHGLIEDKVQYSDDGTIKTRYALHDGHRIESVLIPVPKDNRFTVCVSTQVGCSLSCKFCATGQMDRVRNLTGAEIYDQVVKVNAQCESQFDHPLTNIVYMGMGEPLLSYSNVLDSVDKITSPDGLNMSPKRITVSTAGIAKMIRKLADDKVKFNLALSLHAADDEKRNEIMPINEQNSLSILMDALDYFYKETKNKISFEYIAFKGFNDSMEDAKNLLQLTKRFPVHVNIIEYNPIEGLKFVKSDKDQLDKFSKFLIQNEVMTTVRRSRGKDIDAACGQLANKN